MKLKQGHFELNHNYFIFYFFQGGMANFAFESEEAPEEEVSTNPTKINLDNDANETSTNNQESNNQTQAQPLYILPALFFIHGVGGSANIWSNQLSYFADLGHEVIAPDLLGKVSKISN